MINESKLLITPITPIIANFIIEIILIENVINYVRIEHNYALFLD